MMSPQSRRGLVRSIAILCAGVIAVLISINSPSPALGQGMNHGDRQGLIGAKTDAERQAFAALACSCGGCPHETILTCPCSFADEYRTEVRAMLAKGMSIEEIKKEWVKRYGTDALTVPPNSGGNQAIYILPLVLIVAAAGIVVTALRRFRARGDAKSRAAAAAAGGAPAPNGGHDEYDDKLDDELKQLDHDDE